MDVKKYICTYMITVALAFFLAFGLDAASADAAKLTEKVEVDVEYGTQTITIFGVIGLDATDKEIMVNFPKVTTNKEGEITKITETGWDVYAVPKKTAENTNPKLTIDISVLNPTKTSFVIIKSLKCTEPVLICIDPVLSKIKATYDTEEKTIAPMAADEEVSLEDLQYRTTYGTWSDFGTGISLEMYEQQGATLYFRQAPGARETINSASKLQPSTISNKTYNIYNAKSTFGGKEFKVKVTKQKAAPKVSKVDLDNQAYVLKAGQEYRFSSAGQEEWTEVQGTTSVYLAEELTEDDAIYYPGQFEVRTAAVEATDKKSYIPPSKIMVYEYPAIRTIETAEQKQSALLPQLPANARGNVEMTVEKNKNSKGQVTGITLENTSANNFQVVISKTNIAAGSIIGNKALKPKTLASKKKLTLSAKACPEGSYIYVRYASDKTTGDWASDYVCLGKLTFAE